MLPRFKTDDEEGLKWEALGAGAATIMGLARLCGRSMSYFEPLIVELSLESKAILLAAKDRGVVEIAGKKNAFDSVDRFLSVHVEHKPDHFLSFKNKSDPEQTIRFVDGFRRLCLGGFVMHHMHREFSWTVSGFELARTIATDEVREKLSFAVETSHQF